MTERETGFLGRYGRFVWGGAAALFLLFLAASFVLSGSSVTAAEQNAQEHAQNLSAIVVERLTPDLVTRDIDGKDYLALTVRIQAGILSDDRVSVVRIWRIDGGLIYSTEGREDVKGVSAGDDPWIRRALDGQTDSVLSSEGTHPDGLGRPNEELFQTFIPIRLSSDAVDGVVEIDQRYGAIHNDAFRVWRPLQVAALLLLIGAFVMLVRSLRGVVVYGESGLERRTSPGRRTEDISGRDAADRADRAERRVRETVKRVAELESQLARVPSTASATVAVEELDLKLRASEAEREELAGTVKRLQSELAEKVAEVALVREGSTGTRAESKRVNKLIDDVESRAVAAERKAAAAEEKSQEAAKRAALTAERGLETEAQLREAQKVAADARQLSASADQRIADAKREAERQVADLQHSMELSSGEAQRDSARRLAAAEAGLAAALSRVRELEEARAPLDEGKEGEPPDRAPIGAGSELAARIVELENARRADAAELQRAQEAFANSQLELSNTSRTLHEAEARVRELEQTGGAGKSAPEPKRVAEPAPVPAYVAASGDPEAWGDLMDDEPPSLSKMGEATVDPADVWSDTVADDEPAEDPAEGLSLRERLSRAANARKRLS